MQYNISLSELRTLIKIVIVNLIPKHDDVKLLLTRIYSIEFIEALWDGAVWKRK